MCARPWPAVRSRRTSRAGAGGTVAAGAPPALIQDFAAWACVCGTAICDAAHAAGSSASAEGGETPLMQLPKSNP